MANRHLSGMRAGGRSSGSPGPREEAGPGSDIGLWAPALLLLLCWCLEEEGVPAAPSPPPYNLANSDPEAKKTMSILPESWHGLLDLQLWPFRHPTDSSFMCHDKDPLTISREQITLPSPHCLLFLNLDVQFRWMYSIMSQKKLPTYESSLKEPRTKQVKERGTSWSCRGRLRCGLVRQSTYQHFVSFVFC